MTLLRLLNARPRTVGAVAVLAASLYVAAHLNQGWIAHDEGQLGQSAERVLGGELPHRGFDDMYTGGLSFLNALSFRLFGIESLSMRIMLGLWFVPAIAAFYYIASRAAPPVVAAGVTLLGAMLSLPVYSAPMPSWYNLLLALMGVAAMVRFVETDRTRWLVVAGLCGGASILFKITGVYFVAAGLLLLTYREQLLAPQNGADGQTRARGWYAWLTVFGLLAFAALGLPFLRSGPPAMNAIHFTLPLMALATFLVFHELRRNRGPSPPRFRRMVRMATPFGLGVAAPVIALIIYYASQGATDNLYEGLFVLPRMRLTKGAFPLPGFEGFAKSAPLAALLAWGLVAKSDRASRGLQSIVLAVLALLLACSGTQLGFAFGFHALRNIMPLMVALALVMLVRADRLNIAVEQRQLLFLVVAAAMLGSLVQYPHAYGIYFFYAAPLVVVAALFIVANQPQAPQLALAGILVFYLAFAVIHLNGPDPRDNVNWMARRRAVERMGLERCDLTVKAAEAAVYRELVQHIAEHSSPGNYILAGPDCPQVYYLSQRRNPSPVMYEFFRPAWLGDRADLIAELDRRDVNVFVLNLFPGFSDRMPESLIAELSRRFPSQQSVYLESSGQSPRVERYRVYWRE